MTKIYKIKYSVNLLPCMGEYIINENFETGEPRKVMNPGKYLMSDFYNSDELDIFTTHTLD